MYRHILLPLDGSTSSKRAALECIGIARCLGAAITAIQIVRPPMFLEDESPQHVRRELDARYEALTQDGLRGPHAELQKHAEDNGIEWTSALVLGVKPYKEIVEQARKRGCDLIVMASHRRPSFQAWLHGSQTVSVLTHCEVPVLVLCGGDA